MIASIYGFVYPQPDAWEVARQERVYKYLKAKIEVEFMNPNQEEDWMIKLLTEIATSNTSYYQRQELIKLLDPLDEKQKDDDY